MHVVEHALQGLAPGELFDVVVVGAGGAGLSAALFAALDGARVLIVERTGLVGELIKVVKVIKSGEISRKVELKGIGATAGAKAAIEAAGGSVAAE